MKILHIASNNKFITHAYHSFEGAFPDQNDIWIFNFKELSEQFDLAAPYKTIGYIDLFNPVRLRQMIDYDCVVIHCLLPQFITLINNAPKHVKFIWLGWGADYYRYIYKDRTGMYLPNTRALLPEKPPAPSIKNALIDIIKKLIRADDFNGAMRKISVFSPVLEEDYALLEKHIHGATLPPYMPWNYGSLEDSYIKGFEETRINGRNILIGNSAALTNNHIDAFNVIQGVKDRDVICPLGYSDDGYKADIINSGHSIFDNNFRPLSGFIPFDEYTGILASCGFVVMNHVRQQAVGTIVQMMYMGAKTFLREECPTYQFFQKNNAHIFSVQALEHDPSLLANPLSEEQVQDNIEILKRFWSRDVINNKTKDMIDFVVSPSA